MSKKVSQETIEVHEVADVVEPFDHRIPERPAKYATGAVLASVANAEKPVRTSADEQADPEFHERLARESLAQQRATAELQEQQNEAYMRGSL